MLAQSNSTGNKDLCRWRFSKGDWSLWFAPGHNSSHCPLGAYSDMLKLIAQLCEWVLRLEECAVFKCFLPSYNKSVGQVPTAVALCCLTETNKCTNRKLVHVYGSKVGCVSKWAVACEESAVASRVSSCEQVRVEMRWKILTITKQQQGIRMKCGCPS